MYIKKDNDFMLFRDPCTCGGTLQQLRLFDSCFRIVDKGQDMAKLCFDDFFALVDNYDIKEFVLRPDECKVIGDCGANELGMAKGIIVKVTYPDTLETEETRWIMYRDMIPFNDILKDFVWQIDGTTSLTFRDTNAYSKLALDGELMMTALFDPVSDFNLAYLPDGSPVCGNIKFNSTCIERDPFGVIQEKKLIDSQEIIFLQTNFGNVGMRLSLDIIAPSEIHQNASGVWEGELSLSITGEFFGGLLKGGTFNNSITVSLSQDTPSYGYGYGGSSTVSDTDPIEGIINTELNGTGIEEFKPMGGIAAFTGAPYTYVSPVKVCNPQRENVRVKVLTIS